MVGAAVGRGGREWREVADELEQAAGTFLEHPYANVFKAMGVAVATLDPELTAAHQTLVVYPEDARVPVVAVARLWARLHDVTIEQTRERLQLLAQRELLTMDAGMIWLHDLHRDFLRLRVESVRLLHHELLAAYRQLLPTSQSPWRQLPPGEPYVRDHLIEHLVGAGDSSAAAGVARDLAWVAIRAFGGGSHAAEGDVRRVVALVPEDFGIRWVLNRLSQWGHVLRRHDRFTDLAATLWTRVAQAPPGAEIHALHELLPPGALTPHWGLPDADVALLRVLEGHVGGVFGVAFGPTTGLLASSGEDGTVRLWDVSAGVPSFVLEGNHRGVIGVAFSPDGTVLASACNDGAVRLWDVATTARTRVLEGDANWVSAVAFAPDGGVLASASNDASLRLWNVATGAQICGLNGRARGVPWSHVHPEGSVLASASADGSVRLWDAATGDMMRVLDGHEGWVSGIALSPTAP